MRALMQHYRHRRLQGWWTVTTIAVCGLTVTGSAGPAARSLTAFILQFTGIVGVVAVGTIAFWSLNECVLHAERHWRHLTTARIPRGGLYGLCLLTILAAGHSDLALVIQLITLTADDGGLMAPLWLGGLYLAVCETMAAALWLVAEAGRWYLDCRLKESPGLRSGLLALWTTCAVLAVVGGGERRLTADDDPTESASAVPSAGLAARLGAVSQVGAALAQVKTPLVEPFRPTWYQGHPVAWTPRPAELTRAQALDPPMLALPGGAVGLGQASGVATGETIEETADGHRPPTAHSPAAPVGDTVTPAALATVTLAPFSIGRYEVSRAEWAWCRHDGVCGPPDDEDGGAGAPASSSAGRESARLAGEPAGRESARLADKDAGRESARLAGNLPVTGVNRAAIDRYLSWLNAATDGGYRLPSEEEWEYAARGATDTLYWWGEHVGPGLARCRTCGDRMSPAAPPSGPAAVGSFGPNRFGLYETAGNVWEWTAGTTPVGGAGDATTPARGGGWTGSAAHGGALTRSAAHGGALTRNAARGGAWTSTANAVAPTSRLLLSPTVARPDLGFRLARSRP